MVTASINPDSPGLCPGCFRERGQANPCPHRGDDSSSPRPGNALPAGTELDGKFLIGRVLAKPGGFSSSWRPTAASPW